MKKIYATSLAALCAFGLMAQAPLKVLKDNNFRENVSSKKNTSSKLKAAAIWEDNFDDPAKWSISNLAGNSDDWVIGSDVQPAGAFAIAKLVSTSGGNLALFDSDLLCSGSQDALLTYVDPIDLSAYGAVSLQFEQLYRKFQGSTYVEVSTDNATWTAYEVNTELAVNESTSNPNIGLVNISDVASGQATVYIRFRYTGGCDYAWMVDDVSITETPDNNLTMLKTWHGDIENDFEYGTLPLEQSHDLELGAVFTNEGGLTQEGVTVSVNITNASGSIELVSDPVSIAPNTIDTIKFTLPAPDVIGVYTLDFSVGNDGEDATPDNNTSTRTFELTDGIYSQGRIQYGGGYYAPFEDDANPGNFLAITPASRFTIYNEGSVAYGIDIQVLEGTDPQEIFFDIYKYNTPEAPAEEDMEYISGGFYTITEDDLAGINSGDLNKKLTLVYDDPVALDKGLYLVTFGTYGGPEGMSFGTSGTDTDGGALLYGDVGSAGEAWYGLGSNPYIVWGLNADFVSTNNIESAPTQVTAYPVPAKDKITFNVQADVAADADLVIRDLTGKVVVSEHIRVAQGASNLEYSLKDLNAGVYTYSIQNDEFSVSKKFVVAK